jgi:two-component system sensor histidine kinase BaeS
MTRGFVRQNPVVMKLGITAKLFGAILLANIVMAVAFGVAIEVSVRQGFLDYVKEREERRLASISHVLAEEYAKRGDWAFLRGDRDLWISILRQPPPPGAGPQERPPPPMSSFPGEFGHQPGRSKGRPEMRGRFYDGVVLEDAQHVPVIGQPLASGEPLVAPVVHEGATVGWLKLQRPQQIAGPDSRFLDQILKTGWIVAGIALLLAAIVAFVMAHRLLAPIRRLAAATHRLSLGDFSKNVPVVSEDELGQLTRDFNRLAATLRDADEARRGFLADISHDLRTPLSILRAELDALHDGVVPVTPQAVASLHAEVAMLGHLVTDLYELAVSDLGPGGYQFERVDVASLVAEAAESFRPRMAARSLALDTRGIPQSPVFARGESRRLMQLLVNLLENSLRYTDAGGSVALAVHEERDDVVVDVMDSAPGVEESLRPRIFERLFRVEPSRSREYGGAGLGLALCRSIARAHGGQIEAKASPLGGLWIELRWPREAPVEGR